MAFHLIDLADGERTLFVNAWNWRATLEIINSAGVLDAHRIEALGLQCSATRVEPEEARSIARLLRQRVLPSLGAESRIMLDGTVTDEKDAGTFFRSPAEIGRNYSVSRQWLEAFAAFCESCAGFEVG